MVTSRAVVGSSAISRSGWHATAMAIIARCLIPPLSSSGYFLRVPAGSGILTCLSSWTAFSLALSLSALPLRFGPAKTSWTSKVSMICSPIVRTGFRNVLGSWNTIAILAPLTFRISDSDFWSRFSPCSRISPSSIFPGGSGIRRMRERAVTDLPEPVSPTSPSVSPSMISRSTPSRAFTTPL